MLIGIDNIGGMPNSQFDLRLSRDKYDYIEFRNGTFDEISCSADNTLVFTVNKTEWQFETIFLATFNDTYECGNIQLDGQIIEKLRFYKRKKGTVNWIYIAEQEYIEGKTLYVVKDTLAYSEDEYEYEVRPVTQGIEGSGGRNSIKCEFEGLWVVDRYDSVKMLYNLDYGNISHQRNVEVIKTLDGKYPLVFSTGFEGCEGSNSAVIISKETVASYGKIQYLPDRKHVDTVISFLGDNKPKLWKDGNGRKKIIRITSIDEQPKAGFNGGLITISFNWIQIADPDNFDDLVDTGLLPEELR